MISFEHQKENVLTTLFKNRTTLLTVGNKAASLITLFLTLQYLYLLSTDDTEGAEHLHLYTQANKFAIHVQYISETLFYRQLYFYDAVYCISQTSLGYYYFQCYFLCLLILSYLIKFCILHRINIVYAYDPKIFRPNEHISANYITPKPTISSLATKVSCLVVYKNLY